MAGATNRLIDENSPYLLQHAHNPVNWYPWGDEAFEQARLHNKPIFLSIGYATCHWCHVMERESFEDPTVARILNHDFIAIKVDREERPDIDAVYMAVCQLATGSGGWPLTIVMTPDRKPFFAGTYLPKTARFGRLGVIELCERVTAWWHDAPDRVAASADEIMTHLSHHFAFEADPSATPDPAILGQTAEAIAKNFDPQFGGFETAPKFPMPHRLSFLLKEYERTGNAKLLGMVSKTLTAMRLGGIWDHVGFGFHRYATDRQWLLPHFEKMLYDQALLAPVFLKAYQLTGDALLGQTAEEIFSYVLSEMTDEQGGFYTAQDADSEGEEGKYYVWSQDEVQRISMSINGTLPWSEIFNLSHDGNFLEEASRQKTGANILHLNETLDQWAEKLDISPMVLADEWQKLREGLYAVRLKRIPPLKDDKILTDWNGMMIAALAKGAEVMHNVQYLNAAQRSAEFILTRMMDSQLGLLHSYRQGRATIPATANDYAFLIMGLLGLDGTAGKRSWFSQAIALQETMNDLFMDPSNGGFFLTAHNQAELPVRPKELYDGAIPSANSVALGNLAVLADRTGEHRWRVQAEKQLKAFAGIVQQAPLAYTHMLNGWDLIEKA